MTEETRDDIRSIMEDAVKEHEGKEETIVETAAKLEPEKKEPVKEEVKEETKEPEGDKEEGTKEPSKEEGSKEADPLLTQDKAPSGWAPAVREQWATIPAEVRAEILRREEASAQGVRKLNEEVAPMRGFVQQLEPFIKEAFENGQNPGGYIGQVMASERALRNPDQNQRFQALLNIADQYGIPLREVINESVGREVLTKAQPQTSQLPPEVAQELAESRKWREQSAEDAVKREIAQFKVGKEFFDDVAPLMGDLMANGSAKDLTDAYEQAIWANPSTRQVLLQRQGTEKQKNDFSDRQKAAADAGVTGKETIAVKTKKDDNSESSIEDDIRETIAAMSGRA